MRVRLLPIFLLIIALCAVPAAAQEPLNPDAPAEAGSLTLTPGFQPDPYRIPTIIIGGGDVDANSRQLGTDCVGFITTTPDFRLLMTAPQALLRFIFIADTITADATLVVRAPDGRFLCNNNAFGLLNPMVDVTDAPAGDYAIWIGAFTPNTPMFGALYFTSRDSVIPGSTGLLMPVETTMPTLDPAIALTPTRSPGTFLDPALPPVHGDTTLTTGFLPDPFWTLVIGGGFLPVPALDGEAPEFSACAGFVESAPDFTAHWSAQSTRMRIHFIPASVGGVEPDTALIVRGPDGRFSCNRDFAPGFTRPSVEFISPIPGDYVIWVANEDVPGAAAPGLLYFTELTTTPDTLVQAATQAIPMINGPSPDAVGRAVIFDASAIDPMAVPIDEFAAPAGTIDLEALNPDARGPRGLLCEGFVSATPTISVTLPLAFPYLRVFFIAEDPQIDPVLVVRMPDGQWYCGDDVQQNLNPQVDIVGNAATGLASVWVGTYDGSTPARGTLYLTRGQANVNDPLQAANLTGLAAFDPGAFPTATRDPMVVVMPTTPPVFNNALPTPAGNQGFAAAVLEPYAATNYGETALVSAVAPHTLQAIAGGDVDATVLGGECVGFISAQPDYRLIWSGSFNTLRIFFTGDGDATLVVLDPNGTMHCNDDSFTTQSPTVDIAAAPPGVYNIWIGSYAPGGAITGTLRITEDLNRNPLNP
ncbi:MAG: hypothetical protein UZ15_CFX003000139 [Chloroflexi bacterium OLB15]|nr:MAG: hypothetical protein UZ15_CFX003000139 [Chloroflexi bacterium OLB15]